jgi:IS30 family transposase
MVNKARLSFEDRKKIENLLKGYATGDQIAVAIDKSPSTVYREIRRVPKGEEYTAEAAQRLADLEREKQAHKKAIISSEDEEEICRLYSSGASNIHELCFMYSAATKRISSILKRHNILINRGGV